MQSLKLKRQVAIKAIVTETFKKQATAELQQALQQMDLNLQQLEFQGKRAIADMEKKVVTPQITGASKEIDNLKSQIENEKGRLMAAKNDLLQRLNIINQLEMGSEFVQGMLESYVEVKIGDNLYEKLSNTEIILKDGIVTEIRGKE